MDDEAPARPGVGRWIAIGLAVIAVIAVAFVVGRFTILGQAAPAPATPASDSADAGFARDMQVHHAQAVEMAMEIYRKTEDDELRVLAYDIATGQSAQRGEMYDWLVQWGLPQSGEPMMSWMPGHAGMEMTDEQMRQMMGMASDADLASLRAATGTPADCQFLSLMITHHEGAIPMAEAVIELGTDARVKTVAQAMIDGQTAEIQAMQSMQTRLGCTG